jgi:hypothetical protein
VGLDAVSGPVTEDPDLAETHGRGGVEERRGDGVLHFEIVEHVEDLDLRDDALDIVVDFVSGVEASKEGVANPLTGGAVYGRVVVATPQREVAGEDGVGAVAVCAACRSEAQEGRVRRECDDAVDDVRGGGVVDLASEVL